MHSILLQHVGGHVKLTFMLMHEGYRELVLKSSFLARYKILCSKNSLVIWHIQENASDHVALPASPHPP